MAYTGFDKLKGELGSKPGVKNPGALAASIGRKKYGAKGFGELGAAGKKNPRRTTAAKKMMAAKVQPKGMSAETKVSPDKGDSRTTPALNGVYG